MIRLSDGRGGYAAVRRRLYPRRVTFCPDMKRFTFYAGYRRPSDDRRQRPRFTIHADETCARYRGARATIYDGSGLGDTPIEAAKDCGRSFDMYGEVRLCPRCVLTPEANA
jgi:hypothetical protein